MTAVLDASAVLTLLYREPGHETVAGLVEGSVISVVNWSEVVQKLAQRGVAEPAAIITSLLALGVTVLYFPAQMPKPLRDCGQQCEHEDCRWVIVPGWQSPRRCPARSR